MPEVFGVRQNAVVKVSAVQREGMPALEEIDDQTLYRIGQYPLLLEAGMKLDVLSLGPAMLHGNRVYVFGVRDPDTPDNMESIPLFVLVDEQMESLLKFETTAKTDG